MTAKKSRPHDEAMIEMFQRDPNAFISYVWETLHEQDRQIDGLEKQVAVLKELAHQQWHPSANPPQYRDFWGNWLPPGQIPDDRSTCGTQTFVYDYMTGKTVRRNNP